MIGFAIRIDVVLNKYLKNEISVETENHFKSVFGTITATFYTLLVISMIVSYYYLNKSLKDFKIMSLDRLKNTINTQYAVLTIGFFLRAALLDGFGFYTFASLFARVETQQVVWCVFDMLALVPILVIHNYNFKIPEKNLNELRSESKNSVNDSKNYEVLEKDLRTSPK